MRHIVLLLSFITVFSAANAQKDSYRIKFKINGLKNAKCFIANYLGDKQYLQDSAVTDATGYIEFVGKKDIPKGMYLFVLPSKKYFEFAYTESNFSMETDTTDFVKNMKVKGSVENENFYKYLNFIAEKQKKAMPLRSRYDAAKENKDSTEILSKQLSVIDAEVEKYKEEFLKTNSNLFISSIFRATTEIKVPDAPTLPNGRKDSTFAYRYYKAHYFDNYNFKDDRMAYTPILHNKLDYFFKKLIIQSPDTINKEADLLISSTNPSKENFKYIVHYVTNTFENSNIMGMDAVFVHMVEKYYMTGKAFWVDSVRIKKITDRAMTLKPGLIGQKVVNLKMNLLDGRYIELYSIKAKYTILYFWDPSCGHCKKVTPQMLELYNKIKTSKSVEVFGVGCGDDYEEWKKYIDENKLNWINVMDFNNETRFRKLFDIYSTPVIYVLDENKKIIAKRLGVEQIEELIDKVEESKKATKK